MLGQWRKLLVMGSLLGGLYLPAQANTTAPVNAVAPGAEQSAAPSASVEVGAVDLSSTQRTTSIALLLPLRSGTLREASEVLQSGFRAAHEREPGGITVNLVETGDSPQEILSGYQTAAALNNIVVGPLSRSGVAAVGQSGSVSQPTIALTAPDTGEGSEIALPKQMLVMGLSIEEEARQIADWASRESKAGKTGKALVLFTKAAWQRRAAKAFEKQWAHHGRLAEAVEVASVDGFLNGRDLLQLKKQTEGEAPVMMFLALDPRQARQVRAVMGKDIPLYGTSQLNPVALPDRDSAEHMEDLNGTRLVDIPWQLQPDHPAVMSYSRLVINPDQRRNADLERLYALGIDAYRVARELAAQHKQFEIDGVTGRLSIRFGEDGAHFERVAQPAIYRDGIAIPADFAH